MRTDRSDTERTLPRRDYGAIRCITPACPSTVRIRGEFCRTCLHIQQLQREALRARNENEGRRRFSARGQAV